MSITRLFLFFVLATMPLYVLAAAEEDFWEGIDYELVTPTVPTSVEADKVEVVELFWYGCSHCYSFEPFVDKWLSDKPEAAEFVRLPATLNPNWVSHAHTYYALETIGELDRMHPLIFQAIHDQRRRLRDRQAIVRFLTQYGVDEEKFLEAYNSLPVQTKVRRAKQLSRDYGATGVPTVVVNGKYRTSGSLAGGYDRMLQVINHLVQKEHTE